MDFLWYYWSCYCLVSLGNRSFRVETACYSYRRYRSLYRFLILENFLIKILISLSHSLIPAGVRDNLIDTVILSLTLLILSLCANNMSGHFYCCVFFCFLCLF